MNVEVVNALLCLCFEDFEEHLKVEVFDSTLDAFKRLVDRHSANRNRAVAHDPLTGFVNVLAGAQVHDRVGAPAKADVSVKGEEAEEKGGHEALKKKLKELKTKHFESKLDDDKVSAVEKVLVEGIL